MQIWKHFTSKSTMTGKILVWYLYVCWLCLLWMQEGHVNTSVPCVGYWLRIQECQPIAQTVSTWLAGSHTLQCIHLGSPITMERCAYMKQFEIYTDMWTNWNLHRLQVWNQRREDMTSRRSDNLDALITFQGQESWMQATRMALWTKSQWALSVFY